MMAAGGARLLPPRRVLAVQHAAAADAAQTQQQHERAQAAALRAQQLPVAAYRSSERRGPVALLLPSLAALSLAVAASLPPPARAADDLLSSAAQALIRNAVTETLSRSADEERTEEAPAADEQGRVILRTPSGVQYTDLRVGHGPQPATGDIVVAHVRGLLEDGTVFEDTRATGLPLVLSAGIRPAGVPEGLEEGLLGMAAGGVRLLAVPPELGFDGNAFGTLAVVPAGSPLRYEVEALRCEDTAVAGGARLCCSEPDLPCGGGDSELVEAAALDESALSRFPNPADLAGLE